VTNGLSERALQLLGLLYVPNYDEGVYRITGDEKGGEGIPYILAGIGERARVYRKAKYTFHTAQYENMRASMSTIEEKELTDGQFEKRLALLRESFKDAYGNSMKLSKMSASWDAYVYGPVAAIGLGPKKSTAKEYKVRSNPIVVGNAVTLSQDEGSILFHELIHVNQDISGRLFLDKSKELKDDKYKCELEAYWAQACALEVYFNTTAEDNLQEWNTFGIEAVRRRINTDPNDPFNVSKMLLKSIKEAGGALR
jgi:hypothetical protein